MCRISPSSVIIKKDVFNDIGTFNESLRVCEDYDLWLRINFKTLAFFDVPLIKKYGGHSDQPSKVREGIEFYRIKALKNLLKSLKFCKLQSFLAINMLIKKMNIYAKGLEKRKQILGIVQKIKKKYSILIDITELC